jgi:hypothetical protein
MCIYLSEGWKCFNTGPTWFPEKKVEVRIEVAEELRDVPLRENKQADMKVGSTLTPIR